MKNLNFKLLLVLTAVLVFFVSHSEAVVQRVDSCAKGSPFTPPARVPIQKGVPTVLTVRGDFLDHVNSIQPQGGLTASIIDRAGGGGLNTYLKINVTVTNAINAIQLNYPTFTNDKVLITVVEPPVINSITIDKPRKYVSQDYQYTFTVTGTGLSGLRVRSNLKLGSLANFADVGTGFDTEYSFKANFKNPGPLLINKDAFFDSSFSSTEACGRATGSGILDVIAGLPDLVPLGPSGTFKFLSGQGACNGQNYNTVNPDLCANFVPAPTSSNPQQIKEVPVALIVYGASNSTNFPVLKPFKVRIMDGLNIREEIDVDLGSSKVESETYGRPENKRKLMRHINCPACYDLNVAPFNWSDPVYTVVVDPDKAVKESNETNNEKLSQ